MCGGERHMLFGREYFVTGGKDVAGLHLVPVLETRVVATTDGVTYFITGVVQPVGFAVLTEHQGYWLVDPPLLLDLARAICSCTSNENSEI